MPFENNRIEIVCFVERCEKTHVRWTMFHNLSSWLDSWEEFLIKHGFATKTRDGEAYIMHDQLHRIINIDETSISLDGGKGEKGEKGGQKSQVLFDPTKPKPGSTTNKYSCAATLVVVLNGIRKALPPHIQLTTGASTNEEKRPTLEL